MSNNSNNIIYQDWNSFYQLIEINTLFERQFKLKAKVKVLGSCDLSYGALWFRIENSPLNSVNNNYYSWLHVIEHQSYHLGQIVMLKKLMY